MLCTPSERQFPDGTGCTCIHHHVMGSSARKDRATTRLKRQAHHTVRARQRTISTQFIVPPLTAARAVVNESCTVKVVLASGAGALDATPGRVARPPPDPALASARLLSASASYTRASGADVGSCFARLAVKSAVTCACRGRHTACEYTARVCATECYGQRTAVSTHVLATMDRAPSDNTSPSLRDAGANATQPVRNLPAKPHREPATACTHLCISHNTSRFTRSAGSAPGPTPRTSASAQQSDACDIGWRRRR